MKEFIVTGATGYLGYIVVHQLIEKGYHPVKVITRSSKAAKRFNGLPVNVAVGDILDVDFVNEVITKDSVVFHLAGIIDISTIRRKIIYDINVMGCRNIVDACIANGAQKLIYCSSSSAIEPIKNETLIREPLQFNHHKLEGHYAKSKAIATEFVLKKVEKGLLNAVVLYPTAIIGPYDYHISAIGQVILDYINNRLRAYVKGSYNFVDVRDVATGIIKGYELGKNGEGYILGGETIDLKEMFLILNEKLNREKMPKKLPLSFIKIVAPLAELYYLVRRKKPVFSSTSLKILGQNCNFDISKAINELGFQPRSASDSFFDMIDWFLENKKELIENPN